MDMVVLGFAAILLHKVKGFEYRNELNYLFILEHKAS